MAVLTAMISVGEVMLFSFLGNIVDWLTNANRETFLRDEGWRLAIMGGFVLIGLPLIVLCQSLIMHQVLLGNYPMIARWQMHRYLLRRPCPSSPTNLPPRSAPRSCRPRLPCAK